MKVPVPAGLEIAFSPECLRRVPGLVVGREVDAEFLAILRHLPETPFHAAVTKVLLDDGRIIELCLKLDLQVRRAVDRVSVFLPSEYERATGRPLPARAGDN